MTLHFERFRVELSYAAFAAMSATGPVDDAVDDWSSRVPRLTAVTPDRLRDELREYAAWTGEELADDEANWGRLLWIGCCAEKERLASADEDMDPTP